MITLSHSGLVEIVFLQGAGPAGGRGFTYGSEGYFGSRFDAPGAIEQ